MCFWIDRIVSAKWIHKFEIADNAADMRVRHHCVQLLLVALQNRTLIGVFKYLPDSGTNATDLAELTKIYPSDIRRLVEPRASDLSMCLMNRLSSVGGLSNSDENARMLVRSIDEHSETDDTDASQAQFFYAFGAGQRTGEWMQRDANGQQPCRVYSELTIDGTVPSER